MANFYAVYAASSGGGGGGQTFDTGAGATTSTTLRTVIVTDQTSIPAAQSGSWTVAVNNFPATQPVSGSINVSQFGGSNVVTGTGVGGAGIPRVTVSSDSSITNISGTVSLPTGASTETTLAAMSAKLPATLGQKAMAASLAVAIASDQSILSIKPTDGTNSIGTFGNLTAAQYTSTPGRSMPVTSVSQGWDGTTHREILLDSTGNTQVVTSATTVAFTKKGKIVAGSLTTSYATVLSITTTSYMVYIFNSLNQTVLVSLDGGTTDSLEMDPGESCSMDLRSNGLRFIATTNIQAKYAGTAPTAGSIRISAIG